MDPGTKSPHREKKSRRTLVQSGRVRHRSGTGDYRLRAQQQYREFVRDGLASRPWNDLKGQIYLGSEAFVEKHASGKKDIKEIARAQLRAAKPSLEQILGRRGEKGIGEAYEHGYRLNEIAAHLGVRKPPTQTDRARELGLSHCMLILRRKSCRLHYLAVGRSIDVITSLEYGLGASS